MTKANEDLAAYIVDWLCRRNAEELRPAFHRMRVADYTLLHEELAHILKHGGHPPNWVLISKSPMTLPLESVKAVYPAACKECNDRGTIETGNNDLPCSCPAGDYVLFNTEHGRETGAQIKARRR